MGNGGGEDGDKNPEHIAASLVNNEARQRGKCSRGDIKNTVGKACILALHVKLALEEYPAFQISSHYYPIQ